MVNRDLMATLPDQEALILMADPPWQPLPPSGIDRGQVYVAMPDGRWHGNSVNARDLEEGDPPEPDDATTVLTVVADAAQSTNMELLWRVWPICSEHKIGMRPRPQGPLTTGIRAKWTRSAHRCGGAGAACASRAARTSAGARLLQYVCVMIAVASSTSRARSWAIFDRVLGVPAGGGGAGRLPPGVLVRLPRVPRFGRPGHPDVPAAALTGHGANATLER